jgi:hypothetical protein
MIVSVAPTPGLTILKCDILDSIDFDSNNVASYLGAVGGLMNRHRRYSGFI